MGVLSPRSTPLQGALADSCEDQQSSKGATNALQLADVLQDVLPYLHLDCIPGPALASICMGTGLLDAEQLQVSCSALCAPTHVGFGPLDTGQPTGEAISCVFSILRDWAAVHKATAGKLVCICRRSGRMPCFCCTLVQNIGTGCIPPTPVLASVCAKIGHRDSSRYAEHQLISITASAGLCRAPLFRTASIQHSCCVVTNGGRPSSVCCRW